ncbi:hypothetical protein P5G51_009870 [Virgibacillus sp. 179-BFC.A HS]|uniref:Uncharacterized protein n=1 Tax=Tigheibacillus jepli TaxID=3035914 RepID=A0ABU5CH88_9BACI|nr:hypothetical protein [Virgibacillus sp. 179-BFC.A HS]MDY0405661.1 hypothetical protein [Virgibacillus sp. 179-BFC.A HS]
MKKQTVSERFAQQHLQLQNQHSQPAGMNQLQQIFSQTKQAISQAQQTANQVQAANPEQKELHQLTQQLNFAMSHLQQLNKYYHASVMGLDKSSKQQLLQLQNELKQAEHTLQFLQSYADANATN